jgi:hypothetical protein
MNTFINISLISMIVRLIVERNKVSEQEAIEIFYTSQVAKKLLDSSTRVNMLSPYLIYELWNAEHLTGDFRNSPCIQSLI